MLIGNKVLELHFHIRTIPKEVAKISSYKYDFIMKMEPLYVALHRGVVQLFWLYNNTQHSAKYKIEMKELKKLCQRDDSTVLEILNPEGIIDLKQKIPILIKFHPIQVKEYSVCK